MSNIYFNLFIFFTMFRVSNMINQFTEGLNSCGKMWDLIKANWIDFLPMFTKTSERISRPSFQALFEISWSAQGTKRREEEEETIYHWKQVLKMIEGERHFIIISLMFFHVTYSIAEPEEMTWCNFGFIPTVTCALFRASLLSNWVYRIRKQ